MPILKTPAEVVPEFAGLDYRRLARDEQQLAFLRPMQEQAEARVYPYIPVTPAERLKAFERLNFAPHGLFLPDDRKQRERILRYVREGIGSLPQADERLSRYLELQRRSETWQQGGMVGRWTGQQGVARSTARFRLVGCGRRWGKSLVSAYEVLGVATERPRSWCWACAPTMRLVSRVFDMIIEVLHDRGIGIVQSRNTAQEKLLVLDNGSRIEGISLDNVWSAAGASVDFAVIDEAAQIVPDAWTRGVLPVLADRNGQALLISSWEGEEGFFYEKAMAAQKEHLERGTASEWEFFQEASHESNIFRFPQGEKTPALIQARKEMPVWDYLEQFGAIPSGTRDKVFPEFRERVHVGSYPFNPDHPVRLGVDPSGGSNPYAVTVIQDYNDYIVLVDEFYESHMSIKEIGALLDQRPWRANVTDVVVDSARPFDIRDWLDLGWPAYPVPDKPEISERLPLTRDMLRDPLRYYGLYRERVNAILRELDEPEDADFYWSPEQKKELQIRVEESLSDRNMNAEEIENLRKCSRLFIDKSCIWSIYEFQHYAYPRRRQENQNYKEKPRDFSNHISDALGYYLWDTRRFERAGTLEGQDFLVTTGAHLGDYPLPQEQDEEDVGVPEPVRRYRAFLDSVRPPNLEMTQRAPHSLLALA